jgi:hypothetical protein
LRIQRSKTLLLEFGGGGGDRTKSAIETVQVIHSIKHGKRQKPSIRLSEVHRRNTVYQRNVRITMVFSPYEFTPVSLSLRNEAL